MHGIRSGSILEWLQLCCCCWCCCSITEWPRWASTQFCLECRVPSAASRRWSGHVPWDSRWNVPSLWAPRSWRILRN